MGNSNEKKKNGDAADFSPYQEFNEMCITKMILMIRPLDIREKHLRNSAIVAFIAGTFNIPIVF